MKFEIEHTFEGITPAEYEALYFDEPFAVAMCESVKLGRSLVRLDKGAEKIVRHVRCEPAREIPAPMAKALGNKRFAYVEELEYDAGKYQGHWRTVPNVMPDKVSTSGTLEFKAVPGGTKRVVRGEIKVSVFGIGGIVEKMVMADVEKSYGDAAAFTRQWIAKAKS